MSRSLVARLFVAPEREALTAPAGIVAVLALAGFTPRREPGGQVRSWTNGESGRRVRWTDTVEGAMEGADGSPWWGIALHKPGSDRAADPAEVLLEVLRPGDGGSGEPGTIALSLPFMPPASGRSTLARDFGAWVTLLASVSHPLYGWAGSDLGLFNLETAPVDPVAVRDAAPQPPEWLNVYGEPYVDRLGRERLLAAPAWRADPLADGSIAILLGPHPLDVTRADAEAIASYLGLPLPAPAASGGPDGPAGRRRRRPGGRG